jgi:hypothetical protein
MLKTNPSRWRKILTWIFSLVAFIGVLLLLTHQRAFADDIYNFYFQKAPGPQTVIQGGGPNPAPNPAAPAALPPPGTPEAIAATSPPAAAQGQSVAKTAPPVESEDHIRGWNINLGAAGIIDKQGSHRGVNLGTSFDFNRYVAVEGQLYYASPSDGSYPKDSSSWSNLDGSIGLVLTPIRINAFGWDLFDVSLLGGAQTTRANAAEYNDDFASQQTSANQSRTVVMYWGAGLAVNFAKEFGAVAQIRIHETPNYIDGYGTKDQAMTTVGLRYRF